jgi:NAD(P)-dependent dehydrogenase (short-subunit alcohol dehydrogenase family)
MMGMNIFNGKVCIITGAASGIGKALCEQLVEHGAKVIAADINMEMLTETVNKIDRTNSQVKACKLDVTDEAEFKKTIDDTVSREGRLDYLFNNAGIAIVGEVRDVTMEHWRKVFDVNLNGVLNGTYYAYHLMVKQGFGHIINSSSVEGILPFTNTISYVATKHAVQGLTESLWVEAVDLGVDITAVCPGYIRTPMFEISEAVNTTLESFKKSFLVVLFEKLTAITAETCAHRILKGVAKKKPIIIVPGICRLFWWEYRLCPTLFMRVLRIFHRLDRKNIAKRAQKLSAR